MRFGYSILYVASVADTVAFYERAFGLERSMITEANEYGEKNTGATTLAFAANTFVKTLSDVAFEAASLDKAAPPVEIGLVTETVQAAYDRAVAEGALPVKAPARKPWGQIVGYVRDNNGFLVELCSPMNAS